MSTEPIESRMDALSDFLASLTDWFWETDAHGRYAYLSERYDEAVGEPGRQAIGLYRRNLVVRYFDDAAAERAEAAMDARLPFRELVFQRRSPRYGLIWVQASGVPFFDADGNFAGYRGVGRNVTELIEARRDARRLHAAIDQAPFLMMLLDPNLEIRVFNRAAQRFFRVDANLYAPGETYRDFIRRGVERGHIPAPKGGEEAFIENRIARIQAGPTRADVDVFGTLYELRSEPLPDGSVLFVGVDVTQQRQLQREIAFTQRQDAIGRLTGGIAHDFNNVLAVILGNLELLLETVGNESRPHAEAAFKATERGAELTKKLLAFIRKSRLYPRLIDVNDVIRGMANLIERTLPESIHIELKLAEDLEGAMLDPLEMEQALLNVIINARDAMPAGGVVTISTAMRETSGGRCVAISVADNGAGMTEAVRSRACEPFYSTKPLGDGAGLGLATAMGFARQSGGELVLESAPKSGTTVTFAFPAAGSTADIPPPAQAEPPPEHAAAEGAILVAEDDVDVRRVLALRLRQAGYVVYEAADGTTALRMIQEAPAIDLLLTDVVMPGEVQGFELARQALRLRPGLKAICLSGYPRKEIVEAPAGVAVLSKPIPYAELMRTIQSTLAAQQ